MNSKNNGHFSLVDTLTRIYNALMGSHEDEADRDLFLVRIVKERDTEELNALLDRFSEIFGADGARQVGKVAELIGNGIPKYEVPGFRGRHYSSPITGYMMRSSMNTDTPDEIYRKYIGYVNGIFAEDNEKIRQENTTLPEDQQQPEIDMETISYPSREYMDMITEHYLNRLDMIKYMNMWEADKPLNGANLDDLVGKCLMSENFQDFRKRVLQKDRSGYAPIREVDADFMTILLAKAVLHLTHNQKPNMKELDTEPDLEERLEENGTPQQSRKPPRLMLKMDAQPMQAIADDITAYLRFAHPDPNPEERGYRVRGLKLNNDPDNDNIITVQVSDDVRGELKSMMATARKAAEINFLFQKLGTSGGKKTGGDQSNDNILAP